MPDFEYSTSIPLALVSDFNKRAPVISIIISSQFLLDIASYIRHNVMSLIFMQIYVRNL